MPMTLIETIHLPVLTGLMYIIRYIYLKQQQHCNFLIEMECIEIHEIPKISFDPCHK